MSAPVELVLQTPNPGEIVELWDIDLSAIDASAPVLHVTSNVNRTDVVKRGGVSYLAVPVEGQGFDLGGTGVSPRPSLAVSNVAFLLQPWINAGQDLIGAKVTRTLTLGRYLDGMSDEDPTAAIRTDVYTVEQMNAASPIRVEFLLVARFDQSGRKLPGRQMLANACTRRYRTWSGSAWEYSSEQYACPFQGAGMWDIYDQPTLVEGEDECSKTLTACKLRFPLPDNRQPTTAFPGLARLL